MVQYSAEQWKKSKWDFSKLEKKQKALDIFPDLKQLFRSLEVTYATANQTIDFDIIVRYIVLVYHRFSPFAINEQNIIQRKMDVCTFIGLDTTKKEIEKIIANESKFINYCALYFLQMECNVDWLELQQYLEAYYQIMDALTNGQIESEGGKNSKTPQDIAKTKLQIVKEMKSIKQEIDNLSAKVFSDDNNLLNYVERFKEIQRVNYAILSPEDFVASKREVEV